MKKQWRIITWILIFVIAALYNYLRMGFFKGIAFNFGAGLAYAVFSSIPAFVFALIHFTLRRKTVDSENTILDTTKEPVRISFWSLFHAYLAVFAILIFAFLYSQWIYLSRMYS